MTPKQESTAPVWFEFWVTGETDKLNANTIKLAMFPKTFLSGTASFRRSVTGVGPQGSFGLPVSKPRQALI